MLNDIFLLFILNVICTELPKRLMGFTNGLCCFAISLLSVLDVINNGETKASLEK